MAHATSTTKVIIPAQPAVTEKEVVLTLSEDEADLLLSILGKFSAGGPTNQIYRALKMHVVGYGSYDTVLKSTGSLNPLLFVRKK